MSKKHILYVEDDNIDQMAFKRILSGKEGLEYTIVNSVAKAEDLLSHYEYDLVITDYHLSDGTAHDVIARVERIPIVVVTGTLRPEEAGVFRELGAKQYLAKPLVAQEFLAVLQKELGLAQTEIAEESSHILDVSFDLSYLKALSQGDEEFEREMIQIFLDEIPESIDQITQFLEQGDWYHTGTTIHKLKSKIRLMGMGELKELADTLEKSFKKETGVEEAIQKIPILIHALKQALEKATQLVPQV